MFFKIENNNDCYIKYSNSISQKNKIIVLHFLKRFGCVLHNYCVILKLVLKF